MEQWSVGVMKIRIKLNPSDFHPILQFSNTPLLPVEFSFAYEMK
jgi:hypothetical protein